MGEAIIETVRTYLTTLLPAMDLELFDLRFRTEDRGWVLRVTIDSGKGVSLDDCSAVSRELGQFLDVEDIISHPYTLEVSSPGIERPLRSTADFARYIGEKVKVRLHHAMDGEKVLRGKIAEVDGERITLELDAGSRAEITYSMLSKARLSL